MIDEVRYSRFWAARSELLASWIDLLGTDPPEEFVTAELMATQSAIRQAHDLMTGRIILGDAAKTEAQ